MVSWIARMELDSSSENVSRVAREVLEEYPGPEHATLREAFREWVLGAAESWGIEAEVLKQVKSLKEAEMIYAGVEELKERAHRQGLGEGRREGRAEGTQAGRCPGLPASEAEVRRWYSQASCKVAGGDH